MVGCLPHIKGRILFNPSSRINWHLVLSLPGVVATQRGKLDFPPKLIWGKKRRSGKPRAERQVEDVSAAFDGEGTALEPGGSGMQACGKGAQDSGAGKRLTLLGSTVWGQEVEDESQQAEGRGLPHPPRHRGGGGADSPACFALFVEAGKMIARQGTPEIKTAKRPLTSEILRVPGGQCG